MNIHYIFKYLNLGDILSIKRVDSSQNIVYEVSTNEDTYVLKEYSSDAIKDLKDLSKRNKQIVVSTCLNDSGVSTILPIKFRGNYFLHYQNKYYLIYKYFDYKVLKSEELTIEHIKILAGTLAKIHLQNIKVDLDCQYRAINISYEDYLEKFKNIDSKLYETLNTNISKLRELTDNCNSNIERVSKSLCVSHNDYKLKNILWNDNKMYLIDFDASALSNPIVSLAESAFSLSRQNKKINLDFYREYLKSYFSIYNDGTDYRDALSVAMNGKLQWLEYLFNRCSIDDLEAVNDSISMIDEFMLFIDNLDKLYEIYLEINN